MNIIIPENSSTLSENVIQNLNKIVLPQKMLNGKITIEPIYRVYEKKQREVFYRRIKSGKVSDVFFETTFVYQDAREIFEKSIALIIEKQLNFNVWLQGVCIEEEELKLQIEKNILLKSFLTQNKVYLIDPLAHRYIEEKFIKECIYQFKPKS